MTLPTVCRPSGALVVGNPIFPPLPRWATIWCPWRDFTDP